MRLFELKNPGNIFGMFIEEEDFKKDLSFKGIHVSALFIPEAYRETYSLTNLYRKLAPCIYMEGVLHAKIFFYSPSFKLDWE